MKKKNTITHDSEFSLPYIKGTLYQLVASSLLYYLKLEETVAKSDRSKEI